MEKFLFRGPLGEADSNGTYVSMGKRYRVAITDTELRIDRQRIPLVKIAEVAKVGQGVRVVYLNEHDVPKFFCFTAGTCFSDMDNPNPTLEGSLKEYREEWVRKRPPTDTERILATLERIEARLRGIEERMMGEK